MLFELGLNGSLNIKQQTFNIKLYNDLDTLSTLADVFLVNSREKILGRGGE